ncbi:MAG TPA: ABC transporter ATP-binding protein, partial [Aquabacterium sp.]|nr:ABC transporter ATP-binding protein [Aquabacterium sp.]
MNDPDAGSLVECRNLRFGYGQRTILEDLSFTVPRGKVT